MGATKRKLRPLILLFTVLATTPLLGQLPTGHVAGSIYDRTGATVPGAQLLLKDAATGTSRATTTSTVGSYEFLELRPGTYNLAVEARGFRRTVERNIVVNVGLVVHLDVTLEVGDVKEAVEVPAKTPLLRTARAWGYACGDFRFADLTLPREGVKREPRCFTDDEVRKVIASAPEPLSTIVAITAVLGLRIGETLALRRSDIDFAKHVIRIRQSLDGATRIPGAVKSKASSADLPMSRELETRLRAHLLRHDGDSELLFVNRRGRPLSANKLRENSCIRFSLSWELSAADSIRYDMVRPVLCSRTAQLLLSCSGNCGTLTRESRWKFTAMSSAMSSAA